MAKERNSYPSCVWAMPSQSSTHPRMLCYGRFKLTDRLGDEMRVVKIIASDTSLSPLHLAVTSPQKLIS